MTRVPAICLASLLLVGPGPDLFAQAVPDSLVLSLDSLLNTKISSAAKYQQTISEAASSVTIITAEDIRRHGYGTLPEALAATRGFYLSYDRNYSFLGARGFSRPSDYNNRILLLVDGNASNDGVFGGAPVGTDLGVSLGSLERIEIVRGPGSALYGTGAIFAIVNLVTKPADADPGVHGALRGGSYGARGGSLQYRGSVGHGFGLSLGGNWDGADGHDLFYPEFDSPETNGGIAHDMDWERRWALLGALQGHGFTLHGRYSARTKAIPTGAYDTDLAGDPSQTRDDYGFLELRFDRPVDNSRRVTARAYVNAYRYDGDYITAGESSTDGARNEAVGAEAALHWDVASSNRLTVGGEVRRDLRASYFMPNSFPRETDWSLPNTVLSAYVQDEHQLTRSLSVLAGLRHDSYETSQDATSPRLAAIFAPSHSSTLKLLYGRAFRAPSPYEAADGGDGYKENPELRPETAQTVEAVWQQRLSTGLLGSVSLFHYDVRRLIDLTLDPVDSLFQYRNVGDAEAEGFEVELQGRLGTSGTGYLSYSFQDATDRRTGRWLTNSPRHMLKAGTTADLTRWLGAGMDTRYESGRRTLAGTETDPAFISDLHFLLPAGSATSPRGPIDRLELSLRINNLFDASYATPGGVEHRQAAISQDGRTVSAELRYRF
jgi:outer membrane receptor for ferrienterochelin and colicins